MTMDSAATGGDLLLMSKTWERTVRFRSSRSRVIAEIEQPDQLAVGVSEFNTLSDGIRSTAALELDQDDAIEVSLSEHADLSTDDVIRIAHDVSVGFEPRGDKYDVVDPVLKLDGRSFFAISFDDGKWELIEGADSCRVLATISLFESASRTSGYFTLSVARLGTGHVFLLDEPDEEPGWAQALRAELSDSEAVHLWFDSQEPWVVGIFEAAYRHGQEIDVGSDFDPDWSDTLEIEHSLKLTADETADLWAPRV